MPNYSHLPPAWTDDLQDGGAVRAIYRLLENMGRSGIDPYRLSREARETLRELQFQASCLNGSCAEVFAPSELRLDEMARRARNSRRDEFRGPDVVLKAELDAKTGLVIRWEPGEDEDAFLRHDLAREDRHGLRNVAKLQWFAKILPGVESREPGTCDERDERAVRGHLAAVAVRLYRDAVDALAAGCKVVEAATLSVSVDEETGELLSFGIEHIAPAAEAEGPSPGP
jgi:hypothetical protein